MPDFRFKLPAITELTDLQRVAFYEPNPILVTGGPGSGKTVVSIFRFLRQISEDQNAMFFTFNRTLMSSIRGTLRQQADIRMPEMNEEEVETILSDKITSVFEWYGGKFRSMLSEQSDAQIITELENYASLHLQEGLNTEIFIDEAQDLRLSIIEGLYQITTKLSCGADRSQDIQGCFNGPADDIIFEMLNNYIHTVRQGLTANFRNTREIFDFARGFVPEDDYVQDIDLEELNPGERPSLMPNLNRQEQLDTMLSIINANPNSNIGILVHNSPQVKDIKQYLERNRFSCAAESPDNLSFSYYYSSMPLNDRNIMESRLKTPFILTFDSCKGLEFDIVIMPFFEWASVSLYSQKYKRNSDQSRTYLFNADGTPKMWATPNHYYVGATRARNLLYVLCEDKPAILDFWEENGDNLFDDLF
jgi:superfamily I DNA/RNA helicase